MSDSFHSPLLRVGATKLLGGAVKYDRSTRSTELFGNSIMVTYPNGDSTSGLPYSYYKSQADSLHTRFIDAIRLLREVTAPEAVSFYVDDLQDIFTDAGKLHRLNVLQPLDQIRLKHILDRDVAQHVAIARSGHTALLTDNRHNKQ